MKLKLVSSINESGDSQKDKQEFFNQVFNAIASTRIKGQISSFQVHHSYPKKSKKRHDLENVYITSRRAHFQFHTDFNRYAKEHEIKDKDTEMPKYWEQYYAKPENKDDFICLKDILIEFLQNIQKTSKSEDDEKDIENNSN